MPIVNRFRVKRQAAAQPKPTLDQEEVARVAYALFEQRGRTHGNDQQDWFEAQRIVQQRRRNSNGR